jgi:hypothetical protein
MRRMCMIVVLAALGIETSVQTVSAQVFSGRRVHRSSYDGYDSEYDAMVGMNALNNSNAAARGMAQSYQAWGQQAAQGSATQSGIRSAMDTDAQRRSQAISSQQQSNRDWWYQTERRQVAQRQAPAAQPQVVAVPLPYSVPSSGAGSDSPYTPPASVAGFESAPVPVSSGIIKWPPVLSGPAFIRQRARIEDPYLRSIKGLSTPTPKDYRDMIETAEQMKAMLKTVSDVISAQDYMSAVTFLDQLAAEARGRLEKTPPKKSQ